MAKSLFNCNKNSAQLIENTLTALASTVAASILSNSVVNTTKQSSEHADISESKLMQACLEGNKDNIDDLKNQFKDFYSKYADNLNILEQHVQLYRDALNDENMQSECLFELIFSSNTLNALDILGIKVVESAFEQGYEGFEDLSRAMHVLYNFADNKDLELLKSKVNPENTKKYKHFQNKISIEKRKINRLLNKEAREKRKKLVQEINNLKSDKSNYKKVKELKSQIQNLYRESDNSAEIQELMQSINEKQLKMKEILKQKVDLSPQEILKKVIIMGVVLRDEYLCSYSLREWELEPSLRGKVEKYYHRSLMNMDYDVASGKFVFDSEIRSEFSPEEMLALNDCVSLEFDSYGKKDLRKMIKMLESKSPENDIRWNNFIAKQIFYMIRVPFNERISNVLDLSNCDYFDDLMVSFMHNWFYDEFRNMLVILSQLHKKLSSKKYQNTQDLLDYINQPTKWLFEKEGIGYCKWAHYDENSYIKQNITITAEDARQKAVKNLCEELTNTIYISKIPQKQIRSLYRRLGEIGVQIDRKSKTVQINDRDIIFDDLSLIIDKIFEEFDENPFWSEELDDEAVEAASELVYSHFESRHTEILNIPRLKESEKVDIKVRKVNMNDIKYALCLGNHSHCCTALGALTNEWTAPNYILTKCISAIEVIADDKPVGNTMIYLAHVNGELSLVLDNIELQIKYQNNDKIRDMIIEYAKKLCGEIGKPDIPIYANSGAIHKVDMSPYKLILAEISILGKMPTGVSSVYLDYDQDEHIIGEGEIINSALYKLA